MYRPMPLPLSLRTFVALTCMLLAYGHAQAFWGRAYDGPLPIVRTEPPSAQELRQLILNFIRRLE
jgi:hypothetical protein